MEARHLIALAALSAATAPVWAGADDEYARPDERFVSTRTRTEVLAELRDAQAQGSTMLSDDRYPIIQQTASGRSRDEVRAEAVAAARERIPDARNLYFGG